MTKTGLAIHCHHNVLLEYCYDYDKRVKAIKKDKPKSEQEIRLRLFKILPQEAIDDLPKELVKASAEWFKTDTEWNKADTEWNKARDEWNKAEAKWNKADAKWKNVRDKWNKAEAEWFRTDAEWIKAYAEWAKAYTEWAKADTEWAEADREAWHKKWCGCENWKNNDIDFSE